MIRKVEICGVCTSTLPNLPNSEIEKMLFRIKNGEEELRDEFIRSNLRLVLSVVQRFSNRKENMDDLFQVGCIGLIKALDNFDVSHEVKFSTYAVPMIIGELRRYLRDNSSIRVSRSLKDIAYRALKLKDEYNNKNLSIEEMSVILDVPREEIQFALDAIVEPCSLYESIFNDNGDSVSIIDHVKDEKNLEENWVEEISLNDAIIRLNSREKDIIYKRFYEGKTQIEVSNEIGISQAQVSRLEKNAMENLAKRV